MNRPNFGQTLTHHNHNYIQEQIPLTDIIFLKFKETAQIKSYTAKVQTLDNSWTYNSRNGGIYLTRPIGGVSCNYRGEESLFLLACCRPKKCLFEAHAIRVQAWRRSLLSCAGQSARFEPVRITYSEAQWHTVFAFLSFLNRLANSPNLAVQLQRVSAC